MVDRLGNGVTGALSRMAGIDGTETVSGWEVRLLHG